MYDVILADPPWQFRVWSKEGANRSAEHHYPTLSTEAICSIPIEALVSPNAVLFLWTTWPKIEHALKVIHSWGFEYKTEAWVWVKSLKNGTGFHFGLGYYTRGNTEPCLLCTKGKGISVATHSESAIIYSPRREHSRKPDEQYSKIERLYPGKTYLELFARPPVREGWQVWGNEVRDSISSDVGDILGKIPDNF